MVLDVIIGLIMAVVSFGQYLGLISFLIYILLFSTVTGLIPLRQELEGFLSSKVRTADNTSSLDGSFKLTRPAILPIHDLNEHRVSCTDNDRVCFYSSIVDFSNNFK